MDNNYWKEKYADIHLRLTNKIAELEKENAEMQKALKTLAEGLNKRQMILQEIKKIANHRQNRWWDDIDERRGFDEILDLIIKVESEG